MSQLGPSGSAFAIMVKAQPRMWATKMMRKIELKMPMTGASTCAQRGAAEQGSVSLRCDPFSLSSRQLSVTVAMLKDSKWVGSAEHHDKREM